MSSNDRRRVQNDGTETKDALIMYGVLALPIVAHSLIGVYELMVLVYLWLISVAIFGYLNNE